MLIKNLTLALILLFSNLAATQTEFSDEVKKLVVMLEADVGDNTLIGAGIVFAVARNRIYIVTADHVVRDKKEDEIVPASNLIAKFWQLPGEEFQATLLEPLLTPLDMAVLTVEVEDAKLSLDDFPFELLTGGKIETSKKVISVGQGSGREWVDLQEDLNVISQQLGILEVQFFGVSQGDSGGGIFNENGELLGMTISDAQPALRAIDAETLLSVLEENRYEISVSRPKLPNDSTSTAPEDSATPSTNVEEPVSITSEIKKLQIDGAQATTVFNNDYSAFQAIDGNTDTYWSTAAEETSDASITFLFDQPTTVSQIRVFFPTKPLGLLMKTAILSTPEGVNRELIFRGLAGWENIDFETLTTNTVTLTPTSYFSVGSSSFVNLYELELFGD
jgi:Trypsin-like peptidase domain